MKLGIYGGTFNPVHYGHLRTAEEVFEMFELDRILFVPAGRPPFDKPDMASASSRFEMTEMAVTGNSHFEVSDIEMNRSGRTYTVDTLRNLGQQYPGSELYFIIGIDAFLDMPKWKEPDTLIGLAHVVVLSRPGYKFADLANSPFISDPVPGSLSKLDTGELSLALFEVPGAGTCYMCNVTGFDISASDIRNILSQGRAARYLLPDSVNSYIISNKLYGVK